MKPFQWLYWKGSNTLYRWLWGSFGFSMKNQSLDNWCINKKKKKIKTCSLKGESATEQLTLWWKDSELLPQVWGALVVRCDISCRAGIVLARCGEEGNEPEGKALDLLVCLCTIPHLQSWAVSDQNNQTVDRRSQKQILSMDGWAQPLK